MDLEHCPTCGQAWGLCDSIKPGTQDDVLPVRCTRMAGHPPDFHEHPPLWPGTPTVIWPADD